MTPDELYELWTKDVKSIETPLPSKYEVDADTYAQCCQAIFINKGMKFYDGHKGVIILNIVVGPNNGIMFKGVELILKVK